MRFDPKLRLSPNFVLGEFWPIGASPPSTNQMRSLSLLCNLLLQPLRDELGPIRVNSGYRDAKANRKVGGSSTSQHLYQGDDAAADITVLLNPKDTQLRVTAVKYLVDWCRYNFSQVIAYADTTHLHIGLWSPRVDKQGQVLFKPPGQAYVAVNAVNPTSAAADLAGLYAEYA